MRRLIALAFLVSCSHVDKIGSIGNLISEGENPASSAWQDLPRSLGDYLYADNSPVMVGKTSQYEHQVDEYLEAIYKNGICYGPNGKKQSNDSICKEVASLVSKVKSLRSELMNLHTKKVSARPNDYYQGTVSETLVGCTTDLEALREGESLSDRLDQIRQCKPLLTSYLKSLSSKSDEIRKHPRALDLGLDKFDAFYFLNTSNNEQKVRSALNMTSKEEESSVTAKLKSEHDESFWSNYCLQREAYQKADEIIEAEPLPYRKQALKNDKKVKAQVISKMRDDYLKRNGKSVDDATCSKYQ